mmetsp:Transcript_19285/g.45031  ORF Transcript_19285/g.45031 Transcript_19285/m.45031 type:complete len:822 (-) Transcript_19285:279-2744(-)
MGSHGPLGLSNGGKEIMVPERFQALLDMLGQEYSRVHARNGELSTRAESSSGQVGSSSKDQDAWSFPSRWMSEVRPSAKAAQIIEDELADLRPPTDSDPGDLGADHGVSADMIFTEMSKDQEPCSPGGSMQSVDSQPMSGHDSSEVQPMSNMYATLSRNRGISKRRVLKESRTAESADENGMLRRGSMSGEQRSLRMLQAWQAVSEQMERDEKGRHRPHWAQRGRSTTTLNTVTSKKLISSSEMRAGDALRGSSWLQYLMIAPSSPQRLGWDFMSMVVMAFDAVTIPLQVFDLKVDGFMDIMSLVTTLFWSVDMALSFFSGYHVDGVVEMRPSFVACNYLRSWFPLDILVLTFDWLTLLISDTALESAGILRVTKGLRAARIMRVLRLLRIIKVSAVFNTLADLLPSSEVAQMISTIFKFLGSLLIGNHFVACGWYGIGQLGVQDTGDSWIERFEREFGTDASFLFRYTTSVHWSLTQFTPASMEVTPRNYLERLFAIIVLVFALASFSTLLSTITNSMMHLRKASYETTKQQDFVRRYIADKRISLDLGNRIIGFLRQRRYNATTFKRKLHEDDIDAFKILPDSLREDLHGEVYLPVISPHPFFHHISSVDSFSTARVCHKALSERSVAPKSELFVYGQKSTHMYFLQSGVANYFFGIDEQASRHLPSIWLSEMCLWLQWEHRGRFVADSSIALEIVAVNSTEFSQIVAAKPLGSLCRIYAAAYQERLEAASVPRVVPDTWGDFDGLQEIAHKAVDRYHEEYFKGEQGEQSEGMMEAIGRPRGMMSRLQDMRGGGGSAQKLASYLVRQPFRIITWTRSGT